MAPAVMVGMMVAGTALSVAGKIQEGNANKQAAEYNAQNAEKNAQLTMLQGAEDESKSRFNTRTTLGSIRAAYGAAGVTQDGTSSDYQTSQAAIGERNALDIRTQAMRNAQQYENQATLYRQGGNNAQTGGIIGGLAAGFLGGAETLKRT